MKRLSLLLALLLALPLLTGCLGAVSVDDYKYVAAIGVDGGETRPFSISFLVQSEANDSTSQSAAGESILLGAEGDDIFDAITTVHVGVPYRLNFERVNTIIFSQDMAESGVLERLTRVELNSLNIRQSVKLMVTLCPARSFLQGMAGAGMQNITKLQYSLFSNYTEEGVSPIINFSLVHEAAGGGRMDPALTLGGLDVTAVDVAKKDASEMSSESAQKSGEGGGAPEGQDKKKGAEAQTEQQKPDAEETEYTTEGVPRVGGMAVYAAGTALFDGWKMVGVLDSYDTRFLLMGMDAFENGWVRVPYEGSNIMLYLSNTGAYDKTIEISDAPHVDITLVFTCEVLQDASRLSRAGLEGGIRQAAEACIERELGRVFGLCQSLNSDAMGMGRLISRGFSTVAEWEAYDWKQKYPNLTVTFDVHLVPLNENVTSGLE